ncbi:aspartate/glutamate racemase family protein [uncultured Arthrobacter sp.]|uniref:aspartate/glutamate racemase family protein n=1 Tax=uncultured Arthrobacter sp. TaxID=114050 RepID=UPI0026371E2B|nr:aspartate/glutamate racemase family protein [uncultured Arthrobacter sp.]
MLRIGLLGGISWESTAQYYRLLNEMVRDRQGGLHSADCLLRSVDFAPIEELQAQGLWEEAGTALAAAAVELERGGAELLVLCTNTMHKVAPAIERAISIPFINVIDETARAVTATGTATVGLLGTAFTMEQDFYRDGLAAHGLEVLTPNAEDRATVHRVIYEELCLGVVSDDSRKEYQRIIAELVSRGAEGVILGCTEIELLISQTDADIALYPTTSIHAQAAVDAALAG